METEKEKEQHHVKTTWQNKMDFIAEVNAHQVHMDKLEQHGGNDLGPRPKPLILAAIAGCAGMEINSILQKMRINFESFEIDVHGELSNDIPKIYTQVHIHFSIKSQNPEKDKIEKAIHLTVDKYCGVIAMVKHFAKVSIQISHI